MCEAVLWSLAYMCKKYTVWSSKMGGGTIPYLILEDPLLTCRTFACCLATFYGDLVAAIDANSTCTVHEVYIVIESQCWRAKERVTWRTRQLVCSADRGFRENPNVEQCILVSSWVRRGQLHAVQNNGGQCVHLRLDGCGPINRN